MTFGGVSLPLSFRLYRSAEPLLLRDNSPAKRVALFSDRTDGALFAHLVEQREWVEGG